VGDVNITESLAFHRSHGKLATLTATIPPGRFGALELNNGKVQQFQEKPKGDGAMINGGFFVLSPKVVELITTDDTVWEQEPLKTLARNGELMAYEHHGYWQPMDTLRDKIDLEKRWQSGNAPWQVW
jgi:glucose-1-phosphate cytidylyltransferase